ncbi:hypothetical protein E4U35_005965 [Claviceps purpurea]|nr:hypothetical protein E4U35_005965 [Claviceps purpurea]
MRIPPPQVPKPHQPQRLTRDKDAGKRATFIIDTRTSDNAQTKVLKSHQPQRPPRDKDAGKRTTCIIDTRTSENPQTRIEGKLDDLTKGVADIPSKVCDEFMKRCVESEKELVRKSKEAEGLRSELQSLKKQLQQEQAYSQDKVEQLETKSTEAKNLRSELQSLKEQLRQQEADSQEKVAVLTKTIQRLDEDKRKLRVVIPGNALRHKVSDDEIRQRFVNIRKKIEAVVMHPAYDKTRNWIPVSGTDYVINVCQNYNLCSLRDRVFFLRAAIYGIIDRCIFNRDAFGLAGCVSTLDCNQVAQLDESLCDFEGLLRTRKVTKEVILYRRLATSNCIENSSAAPRDNSGARGEIEGLLFPLLNISQDLLERAENLWDPAAKNLLNPAAEINQLCDDAFALWLLTKKSSDRYQFDGPKPGVKYVPAKGAAGVCGVLGEYGVSKKSTRIAFIIFGALIKTTGSEESEVNCVLEPAHVVMHRARQGK